MVVFGLLHGAALPPWWRPWLRAEAVIGAEAVIEAEAVIGAEAVCWAEAL